MCDLPPPLVAIVKSSQVKSNEFIQHISSGKRKLNVLRKKYSAIELNCLIPVSELTLHGSLNSAQCGHMTTRCAQQMEIDACGCRAV